MNTQLTSTDKRTTVQAMSCSDLQARLEARRREVHFEAQKQPTSYKDAFDGIKSLAFQKIREVGKEAEFKAMQNMTPEQRLKQQADAYNRTAGDLKDFDCPICHNKGFVQIVRNGEIVTRDCKCMVTRRTWKRIHDSGLEEQLKEKRFDNFDRSEPWQQVLYDSAQRFLSKVLAGEIRWFAACGQTGAGKTHICTAIVGQLIKTGRGAIYMPYRDEIMRIKQAARDADEYQPRMEQLKNVDVLYIDDLFKGKITDADINAMYELIGHRYCNRKITIFSTEVLWEELGNIDGAIAGRINEMCGMFLVPIGPDSKKNYRLWGVTHDA